MSALKRGRVALLHPLPVKAITRASAMMEALVQRKIDLNGIERCRFSARCLHVLKKSAFAGLRFEIDGI